MATATYAVHAICDQIEGDRRRPSQDRIMAVRAAYLFAVAATGYATLLWIGSDGVKFVIVREAFHLGCLASLLVAVLAIRILRGDHPNGRR